MSAGPFVNSKYNAQYGVGDIHPIRVQPETIAAVAAGGTTANDPPAASVTNPISAQVTRSRRSLGLHARIVHLRLTGTPPAGYSAGARARIPALNTPFYDACSFRGTVVNYLGTTWETTGVTPEFVR